MLKRKKRIRVRRSDTWRALVTETLPAETPIVFSNDGFYLRSIKHDSTASGLAEKVFAKLVNQNVDNWTEPFSYKIRKNHLSYRSLAVPHPAAQRSMAKFYASNFAAIVHYTSRSQFTIRAPKAVASTYYVNTGVTDLSRFKRSQVALADYDKTIAGSPSYFAYRGYGRLYKFFDSNEFIELEERFSTLWMLDVAKCFDAIYTHTILWSVKDKSFAKESFQFKSFGASFDKLMQCLNNGETSGIVIGPELSRIFAEVILQEVDGRVEAEMRCRGFYSGLDYVIKRYVDDYFVFSSNLSIPPAIYAVLESTLAEFKLGINEAKVQKFSRPFITKKSKAVLDASKLLSDFTSKFSEPAAVAGSSSRNLVPTEIFRLDRLFLSFCNDVKICCVGNLAGYDEIAAYLISSLKNRATRLMVERPVDSGGEWQKRLYDSLVLILRSMLFLYSVAPSVAASYRVSTCLIMMLRYAVVNLPDYCEGLKVAIFSQISALIAEAPGSILVNSFVDLETLNLLLAVSEFDDDFRLTPAVLERIFIERGAVNYFSLVTVMFYIKDLPGYVRLRRWVCDSVDEVLMDGRDLLKVSEKALIVLDFIGCPYVEVSRRESWALALLKSLDIQSSNPSEVADLLKDFESMPWFVDWREIDLLNLLERKELRMVY